MFKLKFSTVKDQQFIGALRKLMSFGGFKDTKTAYNIAKIGRKFDQEAKICQELFLKVVKQYANLDEKGNFIPMTNKGVDKEGKPTETPIPGTYTIPDDKQEAFKKAMEEFDSAEFEIPCHQVKLIDTEGAKLSPSDLLALEPILIELEIAPNPKANGAVPAGIPKAVQPAPAPTPA